MQILVFWLDERFCLWENLVFTFLRHQALFCQNSSLIRYTCNSLAISKSFFKEMNLDSSDTISPTSSETRYFWINNIFLMKGEGGKKSKKGKLQDD